MHAIGSAVVAGNNNKYPTVKIKNPPPASDTPADVLKSFGLDLSKAEACRGLKKYLDGQAPTATDFPGMLAWLEALFDGCSSKAARLMVAIQKSHQEFVPVLDEMYADKFMAEFFLQATTGLGLKVCAVWHSFKKCVLIGTLAHPDCSICTLDCTKWKPGLSESQMNALAKNSSVRELKLAGFSARARAEEDMKRLQAVLQNGNIESVCFEAATHEAATCEEHLLRLAKAVQYANRHGGRVHEVNLPVAASNLDKDSVHNILKILFGSKSVLSVTLPAQWLSLVDLAALKDLLKESSVESLKVASVLPSKEEADACEKIMEELRPWLVNNRQRAHWTSIGTAFGAFFMQGARVDAFGVTLRDYLSPRNSKELIVNKYVYVTALQITRAHRKSVVPYAPASRSGAEMDALIQAATVCPFPQLAAWLAQGLQKGSVKPGDLDALETALRAKCAAAIDVAFNDAEAAQRKEPQATSQAEAQQIAEALFQPGSIATLQNLRKHLDLALAGPVPAQERDEFKKLLLLEMKAEFARRFRAVAN